MTSKETLRDILIIAPRQRRYLGKPKMLVGRRTAVKKHIQGSNWNRMAFHQILKGTCSTHVHVQVPL